MSNSKREKTREEDAERLGRKIRKLYLPLSIGLLLLAIALGFAGLPPWLAVLIAMLVFCVPVFMVGMRIDRLLGIPTFRRVHGVPRVEVTRMILIGSVNVAILVVAVAVTSLVLRTILVVIGVLIFFTLTVRQGERISRMTRAITVKSLPPEKRKAAEEVYDVLSRQGLDERREEEDEDR